MPRVLLQELFAHRIGVIDEARVQFGPAFNVITGETGAGKTLLLGALELCLGSDGPTSRQALTNESRAVALFDVGGVERLYSRESSASGRLRATLDGAPASADLLRASSRDVIAIHGQHDSLTLRNKSEIVRLLDGVGNVDCSVLDSLRHDIRHTQERLSALGGDPALRAREIDFLEFQIQEIDDVAIVSATELAETLEELASLTALADAQGAMVRVVQAFESEDDVSLLTKFALAVREVPKIEMLSSVNERLRSSLEVARDAIGELRRYSEAEQVDEERLERLNNRAGVLQTISRKYGGSLEAVLVHRELCAKQLDSLINATEELEFLAGELVRLQALEIEECRRVRREREFAAVALTQKAREQLPRVALPNASLRFDVDGLDGSDAQILFTPNPGLPEGPLQSLASGGELSRVLLALSLVSDQEHLVTVFDEVDAGVGGQVAQQIGACLAEVGERQQVIAVTHLASVAARAQHHFVIEKQVQGGLTRTSVRQVHGEERVREIARMLSGDASVDEAVALATRLLTATQM